MNLPDLPGPQTGQCHVVSKWAREFGWTNGVEIGVLRGRTFFHLLDSHPDLHMIGVDPWIQRDPTSEPGEETYARHDMDRYAKFVLWRAVQHERALIYRMPSVQAATKVADGSQDFVFIDALHTEAAVREDILAWAPKVKPHGYICGHDWQRPEVRRVLDELLPGWEEWPSKCWRIPRAVVEWLGQAGVQSPVQRDVVGRTLIARCE